MVYYLGLDQSSRDHRPLGHLINPLLASEENCSSEDTLKQLGREALIQPPDAFVANDGL
jgi:hypothetical protein